MKVTPNAVSDHIKIILAAVNVEIAGDLLALREVLEPYWPLVDEKPSFDGLENEIRAELLRFAGLYLSKAGWTQGLIGWQDRAKDALSEAARLFDDCGEDEKAGLSYIALANCYWLSGDIAEFENVLHLVIKKCGPSHPAVLKARLNQLAALNNREDFAAAYEILQTIRQPIRDCSDELILIQFHNLAGLTHHNLKNVKYSLTHFSAAAELSELLGHDEYLGINLGALASCFQQDGQYRKAHEVLRRALPLLPPAQAAHLYETQASIYLDEGRTDMAMNAAESAIAILEQTEDRTGLMAALFAKCRCLLRQEDTEAAFKMFGRISRIAPDDRTVEKYSKLLAIDISNTVEADQEIYPALVNARTFDFPCTGSTLFFTFSLESMMRLGIKEAGIVCVITDFEPASGLRTLLLAEHGFAVVEMIYDALTGIAAVEHAGEMVFLDDARIMGVITGYCPLAEAQGDTVHFRKL